MTGGLYFSPAEFIVMLDLAGKGPCSILFRQEALEDSELVLAFASLFQRGLILRENGRLVLSGAGEPFRQMLDAPWAVIVSNPRQEEPAAICYLREGDAWIVEPADVILRRQYRVWRTGPEELRSWLFDTGLLRPPVLEDADTAELDAMLEHEAEVKPRPEQASLRLERRVNGGETVDVYELCRWWGQQMLIRRGKDETQATLYTRQTLERMLTDCFWREEV